MVAAIAFTRPRNAAWLREEPLGFQGREQGMLAATAVAIPSGTVVGRTRGTGASGAAAAKAGGNTGNGTFGAITVADNTEDGVYRLTFTGGGATAPFVLERPGGVEVGAGAVGTAFNAGGFGFTITTGATNFVDGDAFDITVKHTAAGQYKPVDPTASDGSQKAVGILFHARPISTTAQRAVFVVRSTIVNGNGLSYLNTVTSDQKAAFEAQLAAAGIKVSY